MSETIGILIVGILTLAFDRRIAEVANSFSAEISRLIPPELKWPNSLTPGSREYFNNLLFFVRWWGAVMATLGIGLGLALLFRA